MKTTNTSTDFLHAILNPAGGTEMPASAVDDSDNIPKAPKGRRVTASDFRAKEKRIAKRRARKGYR